MIDWHSHILPAMDDGSRDVKESLLLLNMLSEQDVDTIIATPHFYANDESIDRFLERRSRALACIQEQNLEGLPSILLGAEVRYYPGISRLPELRKLCIQGSKLLLLEMPMSKWTEYTVKELIELAGSSHMVVVLAHIERYFHLQSASVWERLSESGILMQVNASAINEFRTRRKVLSLLKHEEVSFIGSDCHNLTSRPPCIGKAFEMMRKKLGNDFVEQLDIYGHNLLT